MMRCKDPHCKGRDITFEDNDMIYCPYCRKKLVCLDKSINVKVDDILILEFTDNNGKPDMLKNLFANENYIFDGTSKTIYDSEIEGYVTTGNAYMPLDRTKLGDKFNIIKFINKIKRNISCIEFDYTDTKEYDSLLSLRIEYDCTTTYKNSSNIAITLFNITGKDINTLIENHLKLRCIYNSWWDFDKFIKEFKRYYNIINDGTALISGLSPEVKLRIEVDEK